MNTFLLTTEIIVLLLALLALWLDFTFPCDQRIKILLFIIVMIKICLIIYISRQKGYEKCEAQLGGAKRPLRFPSRK